MIAFLHVNILDSTTELQKYIYMGSRVGRVVLNHGYTVESLGKL